MTCYTAWLFIQWKVNQNAEIVCVCRGAPGLLSDILCLHFGLISAKGSFLLATFSKNAMLFSFSNFTVINLISMCLTKSSSVSDGAPPPCVEPFLGRALLARLSQRFSNSFSDYLFHSFMMPLNCLETNSFHFRGLQQMSLFIIQMWMFQSSKPLQRL